MILVPVAVGRSIKSVVGRAKGGWNRLLDHLPNKTCFPTKRGVELVAPTSKERIYIVESLGDFGNDPNLTAKRFSGGPTRSYRSTSPLKIVAELSSWERHSDEQINHMHTSLKNLREQGKAEIYE